MVYKYQEEVIENIITAIEKMEEMTEEHYRVHIGFRHTNRLDEPHIPIYVEVNGDYYFTQQTLMDNLYDGFSKCEIFNYNRVELNQDVFLDLNKLIDKILKDNHKRESFYDKLNKELQSFNIALKEL